MKIAKKKCTTVKKVFNFLDDYTIQEGTTLLKNTGGESVKINSLKFSLLLEYCTNTHNQ